MRIHLVGLPHTETTRAFDWCAYTAKLRRFATMMSSLGHDVYLYAGEQNEAACTGHIEIVSPRDWDYWWPHLDRNEPWDGFDPDAAWWTEMNARAIEAIRDHAHPGDFLGLIAGRCQEPIAAAFPEMKAVEVGIGYAGVFAPYRVFESHAWRHYVAGLRGAGQDDVRLYDAVIPNSFERSEFVFHTKPDDYLLYLGRMTPRKGLPIVEEIAKHYPVVTAGQGSERVPSARDHLGVVLGTDKAQLIARAKAVLVPTMYLEPFGGVAVEAMLSGVPVIATDWGAFTETVRHGVSGFRCSTLGEFLGAVDAVELLDKHDIRDYARSRYLTDVTALQYDRYFAQLRELDGAGWYTDVGRLRNGIFARHLH